MKLTITVTKKNGMNGTRMIDKKMKTHEPVVSQVNDLVNKYEQIIDNGLYKNYPQYKNKDIIYAFEVKDIPCVKEVSLKIKSRYKDSWDINLEVEKTKKGGKWRVCVIQFLGEPYKEGE